MTFSYLTCLVESTLGWKTLDNSFQKTLGRFMVYGLITAMDRTQDTVISVDNVSYFPSTYKLQKTDTTYFRRWR